MLDGDETGYQTQHLGRTALRLEEVLFIRDELLRGCSDWLFAEDGDFRQVQVRSIRIVGNGRRWRKKGRTQGDQNGDERSHARIQLSPLPVVVIVSLPCFTPLTLTSASATCLICEPLPLTTRTSRQWSWSKCTCIPAIICP